MRNWEEYKGIIFGLAYKFSPSHQHLDVDDLVGEGFVCFMEVVEEEKKYGLIAPFEAVLSRRMKEHMLNEVKKNKQLKRTGQLIEFSEVESHEKLSKNPWEAIEDFISLSDEMKEVVEVLVKAPAEFLDLIRREKFKTGLSKYLKKYKGWTSKDVTEFWGKIEVK